MKLNRTLCVFQFVYTWSIYTFYTTANTEAINYTETGWPPKDKTNSEWRVLMFTQGEANACQVNTANATMEETHAAIVEASCRSFSRILQQTPKIV
jgi:hypothetical protein